MTEQEKLTRLEVLISPDIANTELLTHLLAQAEEIILNKRYPFGVPDGATMPTVYENLQLQIVLELYSKMGAEGQTAHNENGVNRTYESADVSPSLLRRIVPLVGSVK